MHYILRTNDWNPQGCVNIGTMIIWCTLGNKVIQQYLYEHWSHAGLTLLLLSCWCTLGSKVIR